VNGYRHHRRVVATLVAAALFVTACGGGDDGATSGEAAADAAASRGLGNRVRSWCSTRQLTARHDYAKAMEADGIPHVWEGALNSPCWQADEARIENYPRDDDR
jgi:Ni/Co efflux regulator RcnB